MTEKGISFVVASGNRMDRLNAIFSGISGNIDFVAENGALVIDHGEVIARESMSEEQVNAVLDFFDGKFQDYRIVLSGIDSAYVMTGTDFDMEAFDFELEDVQQFFKNMVQVDDFHKRPADPIVKITMTVSEKSAKRSQNDLTELLKVNCVRSQVAMVLLILSKLGFIKLGECKR